MTDSVNVNSLPSDKTFVEKAREAYSGDVPDWVEELAKYADKTSAAATGRKIGVSSSAVSQIISNTYRTKNRSAIEGRVRGVLMRETVDCPEAGPIRRDICLREQETPFNASSPHRVAMYHACRSGCPHSRIKVEGGVDA